TPRRTATAAARGGAPSHAATASSSAAAAPTADRELRVTAVNDTPGAADATVRLELPQGWTATPPEQPMTVDRGDEPPTVRFTVRPGPNTKGGEHQVRAIATLNGRTFNRGYEVIEYPHIQRAHIYDDAHTTLEVIDVRTAPNLTIGYVMGVGDQVPPAI